MAKKETMKNLVIENFHQLTDGNKEAIKTLAIKCHFFFVDPKGRICAERTKDEVFHFVSDVKQRFGLSIIPKGSCSTKQKHIHP